MAHVLDCEENDQIAHRRIVAGREILRKYGRNSNSQATGNKKPETDQAVDREPKN
jgi:hypothetical protein